MELKKIPGRNEYGTGCYLEEGKRYRGKIILDNKLYLQGKEDFAETYIPLEKIEAVRIERNRIEIKVYPSLLTAYTATIEGNGKELKRLIKDLVVKIGLKKRFFKREWVGEIYSR
ncbi:MAG: hypothetical protein COZ37_06130 [bacterium (Candidatus Ratteibacteria) CG_4_10_14_3_um_filter_41_18]|uniref:Uncharacterized protein n=4 Tax=Candidatus Ratteibacteria TaxID=2979319 RepID=A0A2M7YEK0_9BACT|nr:MAG: hypothetical protein AUJ76_01280 [Candidatus Omnitrophica bacterium CG1_02_41_171]PIV64150.1 MAG: hypothetical protein COS11_03675 [bacterium (Candidatus Ratteibacteria) CG01_land_8_20_14_3_00_40_19]PIW33665.1 MAG: hypothetical protein COW28_03360 [bacterium (Candidatus Ratteibacteria) CG15_BIG_FIL_POST_REV_8_21_14_020_41_12]PIW74124.1 MAG: hypothetical protein CO004_02355 [bacterium (Candidatus Ratteibacteria) CG_4_8_14_3_um_filter_41_36]PIX76775.1 MAG: hypothetical protein COZ37_06130